MSYFGCGVGEVAATMPQSSGAAFGLALIEGIARLAEIATEQRRLDDAHRREQQSGLSRVCFDTRRVYHS